MISDWIFIAAAFGQALCLCLQLGFIGRPRGRPISKALWIAGQVGEEGWELQGVFDSYEQADRACHEPDDFLAPIELNRELPRERIEFPLLSHPRRAGN
jgi:hypothetical protein